MGKFIENEVILVSEQKERETRFITALKISVPFTLLLIAFGYTMFKNGEFNSDDVILFSLLLICYVYYVIYQIYFGFKKTLIDPVSHVFVRDEIERIIKKQMKKNKINHVVLLRIKNIADINDRYGYQNGDDILYNFCKEFAKFMAKQGFKNLHIGRFINGHFIFGLNGKMANLTHILKMFEHKISNQSINNIEIKTEFEIMPTSYDKNLSNITNALFFKINHKEVEEEKSSENIDINKILLDDFNKDVVDAIDNESFSFKFQYVADKNGVKSHINLIPKLDLRTGDKITKSRIIDVLHFNNYDIKYDIAMIKQISRIIYFKDIKHKIFIEIMPQTLRNAEFRNEILKLIDNNLIDPSKIVLEFNEDKIYPETKRFAEILLKFKELGFSFGLSQFGGANASFEYFKFFDIDFVIYDIEYNKNLGNEKIKNVFMKLNEMCQKSGIKSIIRFVDKPKFQDELYELGVDFVQGFCVGKPEDIINLRK